MSAQPIKNIAILGSGPAGLMAAWQVARAGLGVTLFEKKKGLGRKLLVAGSSGLNITYQCDLDEMVAYYRGPHGRFREYLQAFSPQAWRAFIEQELGIATFEGTSRRWFVQSEGMKASGLLKAWTARLEQAGVRIRQGSECAGFEVSENNAPGVSLRFSDGSSERFDAACFCLGGGSWEPSEKPLRWPEIFRSKGIGFTEFEPSNVGFQVDWPAAFLEEAEGKPIKNVVLSSTRASRSGDLVVTRYGLEGTPIYFAGQVGEVTLDLKPDLSEAQILGKLKQVKENMAPLRRAKRWLNLSEGTLALLYHAAPEGSLDRIETLAAAIKRFPLRLQAPQSLDEAISSSGGVRWDELDGNLMLKRFSGVFLAGEMIDWDAPTGGFLIQGCVSQGHWAGRAAVSFVTGVK